MGGVCVFTDLSDLTAFGNTEPCFKEAATVVTLLLASERELYLFPGLLADCDAET